MRLHELIPKRGQRVVHDPVNDHTVVVTSAGSVHNDESGDVCTMMPAYGLLFTSTTWRRATRAEIERLRNEDFEPLLEWIVDPSEVLKPRLRLVK